MCIARVMKRFGYLAILLCVVLLDSCSYGKFIPEGAYLLDEVAMISENKDVNAGNFRGYVKQNPNARWFSRFKIPMRIYTLSGIDSTKYLNRFLQRIGEAPVVFNEEQTERSRKDILNGLMVQGYLASDVKVDKIIKKKKLKAIYHLYPGKSYRVKSLQCDIEDSVVRGILQKDSAESLDRKSVV